MRDIFFNKLYNIAENDKKYIIISNDFGYAMLGTDPTGYKIIKTDIFGKIKP
jgi:hypothetical protein